MVGMERLERSISCSRSRRFGQTKLHSETGATYGDRTRLVFLDREVTSQMPYVAS